MYLASLPISPLKNLDYVISRPLTPPLPIFYKPDLSLFIQLRNMSEILISSIADQ